MKKGKSVLPVVVLAAAGLFLMKSSSGTASSLFRILLKGAGVAAVLVAVLVGAVIYSALSQNISTGETTKKAPSVPVSTKGRQRVVQLRSLGMNIKNQNLRRQTEEICRSVEKLLALCTDDENKTQQADSFIENYLTTLGSVLTKYARLETNSSLTEEVTANALNCLKTIKTATEKMQRNLMENDIMDIAAEMETLIAMCKRDGLLAEEGFSFTEEGRGITLVL